MSGRRIGEPEGDHTLRDAITHEEARLLISKAWDRELSSAEERMLDEHLSGCSDCRSSATRMKILLGLLDNSINPDQPSSA